MDQPKPLSITYWLIPRVIFFSGIASAFLLFSIAGNTVINTLFLILISFLSIIAGTIILRYTSLLDRALTSYKINAIERFFISAFTFGTIPVCLFLLLNKTFKSNTEYAYKAPITNIQFGRHKQPGSFYINEYTISFSIMGQTESADFGENYWAIVDTAKFVYVRYRNGLLGYAIMTDIQLK